MSDEIKEFIRSFADNVPYTSLDIESTQIEEIILVAESNNHTLIVNTIPINSGTIAIVYEGTLDDKPVILKQLLKLLVGEVETQEKERLRLKIIFQDLIVPCNAAESIIKV